MSLVPNPTDSLLSEIAMPLAKAALPCLHCAASHPVHALRMRGLPCRHHHAAARLRARGGAAALGPSFV